MTAGAEPDLTHTVVLLDPRQAKGLEFDSVLVVEPGHYGTSDLYVALTRATQRLGVLHTGPLPRELADAAHISRIDLTVKRIQAVTTRSCWRFFCSGLQSRGWIHRKLVFGMFGLR